MRQSHLFTKTRREAPSDEVAKNAQLLIRAGFVYKEAAGVYDLMPLGLIVLNKIVAIIRDEMQKLGGQEVFLSALQNPEVWKATGRWADEAVDNWFKTRLKSGGEMGLGFTHEEPLTALMKDHIGSYRDLPRFVYQFQTKFRNEARAKSGVMRGREFLMKDLYSFCRTAEEHALFYERTKQAYVSVFERVGLGDRTFVTFASGGSFSRYSHEFQTLTGAGEDVIYVSKEKKIAVNKEVLTDEVLADLSLSREELVEEKAVEVGNIFSLGTRFSEALGLTFKDQEGKISPVIMGSYGIGPGRVLGAVVEAFSDSKGLVWPRAIAPFDAHVIPLQADDPDTMSAAESLASELQASSAAVLLDDRAARPGEKFADADLIGIPVQAVVSQRTLAEKVVEVRVRASGDVERVPVKDAAARIRKLISESS